jgi:WD40 repeat protein
MVLMLLGISALLTCCTFEDIGSTEAILPSTNVSIPTGNIPTPTNIPIVSDTPTITSVFPQDFPIITSDNVKDLSIQNEWIKKGPFSSVWAPNGKVFALYEHWEANLVDVISFEIQAVGYEVITYGLAFRNTDLIGYYHWEGPKFWNFISDDFVDIQYHDYEQCSGGNGMAISHDGRMAVTSSIGKDVKENKRYSDFFLWDLENRRCLGEIGRQDGDYLIFLEFSYNDSHLIAVTEFGISIWNINSLERVCSHNSNIVSIAISPTDDTLVLSDPIPYITDTEIPEIKLWDIARCQQVRTIKGVSGPISLGISHDGNLIGAGVDGGKNLIQIFQIDTGETLTFLEGSPDIVTSIDFSPDGRYLLTRSGGAWHPEDPTRFLLWAVSP